MFIFICIYIGIWTSAYHRGSNDNIYMYCALYSVLQGKCCGCIVEARTDVCCVVSRLKIYYLKYGSKFEFLCMLFDIYVIFYLPLQNKATRFKSLTHCYSAENAVSCKNTQTIYSFVSLYCN